jgi:hypothetical protein
MVVGRGALPSHAKGSFLSDELEAVGTKMHVPA